MPLIQELVIFGFILSYVAQPVRKYVVYSSSCKNGKASQSILIAVDHGMISFCESGTFYFLTWNIKFSGNAWCFSVHWIGG